MILLYSIYHIYKMSQLTQSWPYYATRCTSALPRPASANQDPPLTELDLQQKIHQTTWRGAASPGRAALFTVTGHRWARSRPSGRRGASKTVLLTRGEAKSGSGRADGSSWAQRALLRAAFMRIFGRFSAEKRIFEMNAAKSHPSRRAGLDGFCALEI